VGDRVGDLVARNGGVLTVAELRALGFSQSRLRRLIEDGALIPMRAGVYTLGTYHAKHQGEAARMHALDLAAVLIRLDGDCAGSHETAAVIHGLHLLHDPPPDTVTLSRPRRGRGTRASRFGVRTHVADLPAGDVVRRFGVPVTSVARTVADLARRGTFQEGVVVADSALHANLARRIG
jgi:predicted transcriptional regulator of viral defense system